MLRFLYWCWKATFRGTSFGLGVTWFRTCTERGESWQGPKAVVCPHMKLRLQHGHSSARVLSPQPPQSYVDVRSRDLSVSTRDGLQDGIVDEDVLVLGEGG